MKVEAATVHPVDLNTRAGGFAAMMPQRDRYVLGWDAAGTVDAVGAGVTAFRPGDAVVGLSVWFASLAGTQAEYVVLDAAGLSPAPRGVGWAQAATLPLDALTADQALGRLHDDAGSVAIVGAAGAVGAFATELAVRQGKSVYAVAGAEDEDFIRGLSAVFVPRAADVAQAIRDAAGGPVDAVIDTIGGGEPLMGAVRDGGSLVTTLPPRTPEPVRGIDTSFVKVDADGRRLARLVALAEDGGLTLRAAQTYSLADAARAHHRLEKGGVRGRLVLTP
jgi:NADPH:quinone reductase-like Zn-dependent oxidoreductase